MLDVARLRRALITQGVGVVAIDGRGGSGKSVLARQLAAGWPGAAVVEMDDFYRPSGDRVARPLVHGGNFDRERLITEVLEPVSARRAGRYRRYDWGEDRLAEWHDMPADAVVLIEGVYSTSRLMRRFCDYAIWVDCPYDTRLQRGVERDGEAMRTVWVGEWMPAEDRYVAGEHPDARADLVLDSGSGGAAVAFNVVRFRQ